MNAEDGSWYKSPKVIDTRNDWQKHICADINSQHHDQTKQLNNNHGMLEDYLSHTPRN